MLVKLIREKSPILQIGKRLRKDPHLVLNKVKGICDHDSRIISKDNWDFIKAKVMRKGLFQSQKGFEVARELRRKCLIGHVITRATSQKVRGVKYDIKFDDGDHRCNVRKRANTKP